MPKDNKKQEDNKRLVVTVSYSIALLTMSIMSAVYYSDDDRSLQDSKMFVGLFLFVTLLVFIGFVVLVVYALKILYDCGRGRHKTNAHGKKTPYPDTAIILLVMVTILISMCTVITITANVSLETLTGNPPLLTILMAPIAAFMVLPLIIALLLSRYKTETLRLLTAHDNATNKTNRGPDDKIDQSNRAQDRGDVEAHSKEIHNIETKLLIAAALSSSSGIISIALMEGVYYHNRSEEDISSTAYVWTVSMTIGTVVATLHLFTMLMVRFFIQEPPVAEACTLLPGDPKPMATCPVKTYEVTNQMTYGAVMIYIGLLITASISVVILTTVYPEEADMQYHPSYVGLLVVAVVTCFLAIFLASAFGIAKCRGKSCRKTVVASTVRIAEGFSGRPHALPSEFDFPDE